MWERLALCSRPGAFAAYDAVGLTLTQQRLIARESQRLSDVLRDARQQVDELRACVLQFERHLFDGGVVVRAANAACDRGSASPASSARPPAARRRLPQFQPLRQSPIRRLRRAGALVATRRSCWRVSPEPPPRESVTDRGA